MVSCSIDVQMSCPSPVSLNMKFNQQIPSQYTRLCPCCEDSARGAAGLVEPLTMLSGPLRLWWSLVGDLEHFLFFHRLGISSSQLTHIFQRGGSTTNQESFGTKQSCWRPPAGRYVAWSQVSLGRWRFHRFHLSQEPAGL